MKTQATISAQVLDATSLLSILQAYSVPPWGTGIPTAEQLVSYMLSVYQELRAKGLEIPIVLTERAYEVLASILQKLGVEVEPVEEDEVENGILVDYNPASSEIEVSLKIGDELYRWGISELGEFIGALEKFLKKRRYYVLKLTRSRES